MRNSARATDEGAIGQQPRNPRKTENRVITAAERFGARVATVRRPPVASPTGTLDVDARPSATLLSAAADAASANVELVAESLQRAVEAIGRGDWKSARLLLTQGATTACTLVLVTDMLVSVPSLTAGRKSSIEVVVTCVRAVLTTLESKRRRGDWEGVTTLLEQDMASLLGEWSAELRAIGQEAVPGFESMPRLPMGSTRASMGAGEER